MAQKPDKVWIISLGWIFANFLGVAAIGGIRFTPLTAIPGILVSSLLIGLPIGLAQWIALRRVAPISVLWVLTISAGLILGHVVTPILGGILGFLDDESVLLLTLIYTSIGALVGMAQWLLLRAHFNRSMIWLLANAAGFGLGIAIVLITNLINQSGIASIILVTFVYTITTGAVISWLSGSNRKSERILFNTA
jgi:hypothetical protein